MRSSPRWSACWAWSPPLYVVASVLRLHGEETAGRAEPVLANAVGRLRWAAGHLAIAFGGAALIMLAGGPRPRGGLRRGRRADPGAPPWCSCPRCGLSAAWRSCSTDRPASGPGGLGRGGRVPGLGWIGPALDAPQTVLDLSPFGHLPKLPGAEMRWTPVLTLLCAAALLVAAGLAGLRRRDMTSS